MFDKCECRQPVKVCKFCIPANDEFCGKGQAEQTINIKKLIVIVYRQHINSEIINTTRRWGSVTCQGDRGGPAHRRDHDFSARSD
jgi:hypothetical protein